MAKPSTSTGIVVVAVLVGGCTERPAPPADPAPAAPPPAPVVVDVTALDFSYQAPDTIPGGWVTIRIHNNGQELHHGQIFRLDQGKTLADVTKLTTPAPPEWLVPVGGPSAPAPGGSLETTVNLAPGNYVLTCEIPSPDGKLHSMKGMMKAFTVASATPAVAPVADITVTLSDYTFAIAGELTAGKHTFRVESAPGQPHEFILARLAPGKKAEDFAAWVEKMNGPPPIEGIAGGTTALLAGHDNVFQAELARGDYALICFIPDAKDGKPHAAHGMLRTIKIT